jgi:hypothetical protein
MANKDDDSSSAPTRIREVRPAGSPEPKVVKPSAPPAQAPKPVMADHAASGGGGSSAATQIRGYGGGGQNEEPMAMGKMEDKGVFDPVVGWLVITHGPGRGKAVNVFAGMNSVGRSAGQRVRLDFGDGQVSGEGACFITFEPKRRTFHISHGGKANIVYLNDEAVLTPMPLASGHVVTIGETKLRFVALCGPDFNWEDMK